MARHPLRKSSGYGETPPRTTKGRTRHDAKLPPLAEAPIPDLRRSASLPRSLRRRLSAAARDGADPLHRDDPRCRVRGSVPVAGGPGQRGDAGLHRPAERVRRTDRRQAAGARLGAAAAGGADRHAVHRFPEQGRRVRTLHSSPGRRGAGVHRAQAGAGGRGGRTREDRPGGRVRGRDRPVGSRRRLRPPRRRRRFARREADALQRPHRRRGRDDDPPARPGAERRPRLRDAPGAERPVVLRQGRQRHLLRGPRSPRGSESPLPSVRHRAHRGRTRVRRRNRSARFRPCRANRRGEAARRRPARMGAERRVPGGDRHLAGDADRRRHGGPLQHPPQRRPAVRAHEPRRAAQPADGGRSRPASGRELARGRAGSRGCPAGRVRHRRQAVPDLPAPRRQPDPRLRVRRHAGRRGRGARTPQRRHPRSRRGQGAVVARLLPATAGHLPARSRDRRARGLPGGPRRPSPATATS